MLLNAWMPHNQQAEGGAGTVLCPHISSTNIKKSREKGKEIPYSLLFTLPEKIAPQTAPLLLHWLGLFFWLGAEPHLAPLLSCHMPHTSSPVSPQWQREGPRTENFCRGQRAASAPGPAWESQGWAATRLWWKSLHFYSLCNSLLGSPQDSTEEKEMGRGKKKSEKLLCPQGKKVNSPI